MTSGQPATTLPKPLITEQARSAQSNSRRSRLIPGLLLSVALGAASIALASLSWFQQHGVTALTLAIVLGMLLGNSIYPKLAPVAGPGVVVSKQTLLRLGVILYGLRLTFHDVGHMGFRGILVDLLVLSTTFVIGWQLGTRLLKLERSTAMLIGAGSAICGAAAVMATEPVVEARAEQVTVAVGTVVVFGTLGMFLYPALYHWGLPAISERAFGLYAGSTIHEVAQVVVASTAIGPAASDIAVIAKMVRVMMLAPFLLLLSTWLAWRSSAGTNDAARERRTQIKIPYFAVGFIAMTGLNSLHWLPQAVVHVALDLDTLLLATAMAGLGLGTHVSAIRQAGLRPLLLAAALFVWLVAGGFAINILVSALMR
jgi:uncharacterized integral membrane protein (TIGR00698 family)